MVWDLATMKRLNGPWPESPEGVVKRLVRFENLEKLRKDQLAVALKRGGFQAVLTAKFTIKARFGYPRSTTNFIDRNSHWAIVPVARHSHLQNVIPIERLWPPACRLRLSTFHIGSIGIFILLVTLKYHSVQKNLARI